MNRLVLALVAGVLLAGCDSSGAGVAAPPATPVALAPPSPAAPPTPLPGEPMDLYPYSGAELAVVGVAAADTLNLRTGPGPEFDALVTLAPLARGIRATGHGRSLADRSWWLEVQVDGRTGWINARYTAQPGRTSDVTAELGGPVRAATMAELATALARARGLDLADQGTVTVVDGPRAGDLDEMVVDLLGLADDAQSGERLHVFAVRADGGYTVRTAESTVLCARGVTADGACV